VATWRSPLRRVNTGIPGTPRTYDDGNLCEATLEAYFQLISENSSVTEEELWDWTLPPLNSDKQNERALH